MKLHCIKLLVAISLLSLCCRKTNYYPDPDDPGLSRFTARGYNVATMYINGTPYINLSARQWFGGAVSPAPTVTTIRSSSDTLEISWRIDVHNDSTGYNSNYYSVSLLLPVSNGFTAADFLAMNGQRLSAGNAIIVLHPLGGPRMLQGPGNIYFVNIHYVEPGAVTPGSYELAGLFDGNIGDSISVTKGRFDFSIDASQIRF